MASTDKRLMGRSIARLEFAAQTFPATLTAAKTATLENVNGIITALEVVTTDTQDNITYTVAVTNANGATLSSFAAIADNSTTRKITRSSKAVQDADFNEQPVADETLTVTITPSAAPDAGNVGVKTATVTVSLYLE